MTIAENAAPALPSFGILARFREIFSLAFRRRPGIFVGFNLLALLFVLVIVLGIPFGVIYLTGEEQALAGGGANWVTWLVAGAGGLFWLFCHGVMTMAGCDEMAGERRSVGFYLRHILVRLPALVVLGLLASVAIGIGFFMVGIVGLWASAVFSVFMPAILWDDAGWGGLGRSRRLTKEYRWPIVGLLLLTAFVVLAAIFAPLVLLAVPFGDWGGIVGGLLVFVMELASIPVVGALPVVIHSRLREVKEGGGAAALRTVFE